MTKPWTVRLIGRPNVGKSALFNRVLGKKRAIVLEQPGTTLDDLMESLDLGDGMIDLVDGKGFEDGALEEADAYWFVVDAVTGETPYDRVIAQAVRRKNKPVLLCVNKSEGGFLGRGLEFSSLGIENINEVSAFQGTGLTEIKDWIKRQRPRLYPKADITLSIAIVGRPNTGKSTLMNRLCHEKVSTVSHRPLTTRDIVTFESNVDGNRIRFIDTAGLRRKSRYKLTLENLSSKSALAAIRQCDVAVILIQSQERITDQDKALINLTEKWGKSALLLLNFWDKLDRLDRRNFMQNLHYELRSLATQYEILSISALTGFGINQIVPSALKLHSHVFRLSTSKLNRLVHELIENHPPPSDCHRPFHIFYASQVREKPPTFVVFSNRKKGPVLSYQRFLKNQLRDRMGLKGQAIRMYFRES